ncbi:MAG: hypothetical protein LBD93_02385 [Treponema sp.]|nr:hypothetical protein [Treponema sp.]
MKKTLVSLVCLLLLGSGVFALDKAAGGGLLVGGTFQGGSVTYSYYEDSYYGSTTTTYDWTFNRTSFGGFGFFSISQYLELNVAFMYKAGEAEVTVNGLTYSGDQAAGPQPTSALGLGAYGKYPIPISDTFVFFPTAGVDFEFNFEDYWWNDLWVRGGVGLDFFLNDTMFLRGHFIYGAAIPVGDTQDLSPEIGHGLLAKVGLGFMF